MEQQNEKPLSLRDRYRGAMLGLAIGDAVGTTLEFEPRGSFAPITDMIGGGPFGLESGQWTDDTSMALCLAESLIHCRGFDAGDQMSRYVAWWKQGHLSSTGRCFDIGNATSSALERYLRTKDPMSGSSDPSSAGNGSLMRLAPIPLAFRHNPSHAVEMAAQSSRTTHAATEAVDACRLMALLIIRALDGASKAELLEADAWERRFASAQESLAPAIETVARGSFKTKTADQISGSGYVVESLEAALWAFHHHDTYKEAILAAANLGDDADTTAAICGQLAGAFYGVQGIPAEWSNQVAMRETIVEFAGQLLDLSDSQA